MLNRRARLRLFCRKKTHIKRQHDGCNAIMQWHSQCVGWSGFLDGFDCIDGWQPKGSGKSIPSFQWIEVPFDLPKKSTSWRRISVSGRHGSAIQFCVVFGKLCFFDFWFNISWPVAYLSSSTPGTMLKNWWSVPHSTYPYMQARSRNSLYFRGVALVDSHGLCVALIDSQTRCTVQIGCNRYLQTKKGYARQSG